MARPSKRGRPSGAGRSCSKRLSVHCQHVRHLTQKCWRVKFERRKQLLAELALTLLVVLLIACVGWHLSTLERRSKERDEEHFFSIDGFDALKIEEAVVNGSRRRTVFVAPNTSQALGFARQVFATWNDYFRHVGNDSNHYEMFDSGYQFTQAYEKIVDNNASSLIVGIDLTPAGLELGKASYVMYAPQAHLPTSDRKSKNEWHSFSSKELEQEEIMCRRQLQQHYDKLGNKEVQHIGTAQHDACRANRYAVHGLALLQQCIDSVFIERHRRVGGAIEDKPLLLPSVAIQQLPKWRYTFQLPDRVHPRFDFLLPIALGHVLFLLLASAIGAATLILVAVSAEERSRGSVALLRSSGIGEMVQVLAQLLAQVSSIGLLHMVVLSLSVWWFLLPNADIVLLMLLTAAASLAFSSFGKVFRRIRVL